MRVGNLGLVSRTSLRERRGMGKREGSKAFWNDRVVARGNGREESRNRDGPYRSRKYQRIEAHVLL